MKKFLITMMCVIMVIAMMPGMAMASEVSNVTTINVGTNEEFEAALTNTAENVVINLSSSVTCDVTPWQTTPIGGETTKSVTINGGEGITITFNQTNSDWNHITTNGAKLIINNAHITNSGHNDGPWNRHDLNFACEVELNNVTSDKAIALKADATLNNVTINDANTSDTYAIWIQPNGQTVSIDECTIDMLDCTDGRGIKIDEQYVDVPVKVTLNVSNTTFKTEEKSAIIVKSNTGADIALSNVNIEGVAADSANAVWVDEASEQYAELVNVTGGTKVVEGKSIKVGETYYATLAEAVAACSAETETTVELYNEVVLAANESLANGKTVKFVGKTEGAAINFGNTAHTASGANLTFEDLVIKSDDTDYTGLHHVNTETYNNCEIQGEYWTYGTAKFTECTFTQTSGDYCIWTYGAPTVTFEDCTFNAAGKAVLVYKENDETKHYASFDNCTFTTSKAGTTWDGQHIAAIEIDASLCPYEVAINDCTANTSTLEENTGFAALYRIKKGEDNVKVTVTTTPDPDPYYPPVIITPSTPKDDVVTNETTNTGAAGETVVAPTTNADVSASTTTTTTETGEAKTETKVEQTTADKIVESAVANKSEEVVIDATTAPAPTTGTTGTTTTAAETTEAAVVIPTQTIEQIAQQTEAAVTIKTDVAEIKLDNTAAAAIAEQAAEDGTISIVAVKTDEVVVEDTTEEGETKAVTEVHFELKVVCSERGVIGDFKGGEVTVTVPVPQDMHTEELVAVYIDAQGHYHRVTGVKNANGTFTFTTDHFSSYAVMTAEEAEKAIAEQKAKVESVKLKLRSANSKTSKGKKAIKLTVSEVTDTGIDFDGYVIYRSTKKTSGFKKIYTTKTGTYYNTSAKKGVKYYYKAKGFVTIDGEKIYTGWSKKAIRTAK